MTSRRGALPAPGLPDDVLALQLLAGFGPAKKFTSSLHALHWRAGGRARPVSMILFSLA